MAKPSRAGVRSHRLPAMKTRPAPPWPDRLLRWVSLPSAFVNTTVMVMADIAGQKVSFWLAFLGAVLSFYGFLDVLEQARGSQ